MVIIVSKEGQLANRILHASSFIVNAEEHHYRVIHLFFDDFYSFFSESFDKKNTPLRFLSKKTTRSVKLFQKAVTILIKGLLKLKITQLPFLRIIKYEGYEQGAIPFDLNNKTFLDKAKSKLVFVYGWAFRDFLNQEKYKKLLIDTWTPNRAFRENIEKYYNKYKKGHDVLIGVHIRGGDYKKFEGGKWYYTAEQYYTKMKELASLKVFEGKKLSFIICTNEKNILLPATQNFSVLNEERHFVEDLYLLAKCDYIIGPPSTFSLWASFYGSKPLYMIRDLETNITDEIFKKNSEIQKKL